MVAMLRRIGSLILRVIVYFINRRDKNRSGRSMGGRVGMRRDLARQYRPRETPLALSAMKKAV